MRLFSPLFAVFFALLPLACPSAEGAGEEGEEGEEGEGEEVGPGGDGDVCAFNADCGAGLRCGCEAGLCLCEAGVRGAGENGVDTCLDEDDCASAVCAEDAFGSFTCSGVCDDDSDCAARLPRCIDVAFVGRICVR